MCTLASTSERKLLRSGYDSPIDFSTITGGKSGASPMTATGTGLPGFPSLDSAPKAITGGQGDATKLLPSGLPSTDSFSSLTSLTKGDALPIASGTGKNILPTDVSALTGKNELSSLTDTNGVKSITKGLAGDSNQPDLNNLPIGGGSGKGFAGLTDDLTDLPLTSSGKKVY
ncbi:hypothetical protein JM18_007856 [Phytophthora kernoviae]|uniref:Uncharacterized protein n=2 Tax=Phytophthora kernoviae TaxID=325452 RepID=A0A921SB63_9STRA|nr:hypothetical protein JM18_007856 [Phytophthora kernoviae]